VYARIERSGEPAFHTSGEFVLEAPPGKIGLEAVRGLEYWPAKLDVHIKAHATAGVELKLRRMANEAARGWYSGTTHSHMNYGGNLRNSPENMVAMARAEDLRAVMALVANKDNRVLDRQYFIAGGGGHPASQRDPDVYLHVGEEYRPPLYGHVSLLGLRDHLISPFTTGYEGTAIESLYPSNTNILRKARAQGALTTYLHPFAGDNDPLEADLGHAKALPVDAALGTVDCLEWTYINSVQMAVWHHLLNNDIVLTPVGGEDSITDLHRGKQIGSVRTYARVDGPLTIESWLGAIRKGRTYFTSGPILDFQINGKLPGEILRLPASGGAVTLEGTVRSIAPLSKVSIHSNGCVWKEIPLDNDGKSAAFREVASIAESGWFSLYSEGPPNGALDGEFPQAATNVVRVYVGEKKIRNRASAEYFLRWMDKLTTMTEEWPWWRSETEKSHVLSEFAQARKAYETLAREAQ
jgi:TolB protein